MKFFGEPHEKSYLIYGFESRSENKKGVRYENIG